MKGALASAVWQTLACSLFWGAGCLPQRAEGGGPGGKEEGACSPQGRLTLFPRGRLGDGAWRDHVQEVLPLAVHSRGGLVHCQAGADKRKRPTCTQGCLLPVGGGIALARTNGSLGMFAGPADKSCG